MPGLKVILICKLNKKGDISWKELSHKEIDTFELLAVLAFDIV